MDTIHPHLPSHPSRRQFLATSTLAGAAVLATPRFAQGQPSPPTVSPDAPLTSLVADPWAEADAILARIVAPVFPSREFAITGFGAAGDGRTDCTAAIRKAIAACHAAGGGRVVRRAAPPGAGARRSCRQATTRRCCSTGAVSPLGAACISGGTVHARVTPGRGFRRASPDDWSGR